MGEAFGCYFLDDSVNFAPNASPIQLTAKEYFYLHLGNLLHSMGVMNLQGNDVAPRCDLYRQHFCDRLNVN